VISVALGELGLTYDYFLRMSWAEFRIRLFAYKRQLKEKQYLVREVAYQVYLSGYMGKGKPLTKDKYWPIDGTKRISVTDKVRERILEAQREFQNRK
jgi:hypothetical protein